MEDQKKRTYNGVYDALGKISEETGVDFGLSEYTPETFKQRYFTGPGNINILYDKLDKVAKEANIDFGLGTRDEWLGSFGYKRSGEEGKYETLGGVRVGGKADVDRFNAYKQRQQQKAAATKPQMAPAAVQAPTAETPADVTKGTPWGASGSATGQSRKYVPFTPGQVRTTDNPDADLFPNPTQQTYAERDQVLKQNDWAAKQIEKMQKARERREQPLVDAGNEEVNQHIIKTQGEWDDDLVRGASRISNSIVIPAVDQAIKQFDEKANEVYKKYNEQSKFVDAASPFGLSTIRQANQVKDPEKVLKYLEQQMESVYKDSDFIEQIGQEADKMGIDRSDYLEQVIKPQIASDLTTRFENSMIARELPKSSLEYVVSGLNNSIVGMIADTFLNTKAQRAYKNQAQGMTEEGKNPYYNPSTSASLAKIGVTFAADAPFFGVYGRVGGQVVKNIAEREIQNMMAKGLSESAARSIVGTALENSAGARMKNYIMQHVISGAITMGGFNATSEAARQIRDDDYSLTKFLGATAEGAVTGSAFGLTGGVAQALTQPLSGFAKIGGKLAGFGAEAETMYATEEAAKLLQGEDAFENPFEGSVESLMKLGVMKLSSGHLLGKGAEKLIRAKEVGAKQTAIETAADIWNRKRTGIQFTPEEEDYVRTEGQSLLDALSGMHPERAISEVNGKVKLTAEGETMRQQLAEAYNDFMNNTEVPANVKQKVAKTLGGIYRPGLETGADIIQNEDGSVVIKTRDQDGNCIQEIPFENYDAAVDWQQNFKSQMSRNDATNMYNNTSLEAKQRIIDIIRDLVSGKTVLENTLNRANSMKQNRMKRELEKYNRLAEQYEGREMTDEEARNYIQMVIKDGSDEVFNDLYNIIRQEAYPADELNTKRNYWEGKQIPDLDKHYAQVDAQLAEEQLMLLGEDFANEVIAAADYPDEKMIELASRRDISGTQLKAALDYFNKTSKLNGMMDETLKSIDDQVKAANAYVDRNTHPDSQSIIEVQDSEGNTYYVSAGHIQITPDGKLVGTDNTGMVILRNVDTGEIFTKNPQEVTVSAIKDPQMLKETNDSMDGLRGELMNQANENIEINPEAPQEPQTDGEIYLGADGKQYMTVAMQDEAGNTQWAKFELDEAGNPVGEPQPFDYAEYRKAKSDELDAATMSESGLIEEPETPVIEPNETPIEQNLAEAEQQQPVIEQPETPQESESKIPVNEKGEQVFEQAKPEDTLAELNAKYGEEKAQKMISQIAQATAKELEKLEAEDTSGITDMAKLMEHEDKIKELQQKRDYWNNLIKKEEPAVKEPLTTEPVAEAEIEPVIEPETPEAKIKPEEPIEPKEIIAEAEASEEPIEPKEPIAEAVQKSETLTQEPEKPVAPQQPAVPEKSAQQKIHEAAVAQNVGKRFTYTDNSGMRTAITIDQITDDGKVVVTRQDFDADGKPMDKPRQQTFEAARIGQGIVEGQWKPVASTEEELRQVFKGKPAMQNMIDVLSEEEQQRMLDTYKSGDEDAFRELMDEFRENHREDMVLRERDNRNASVDRILTGAGSREDKLRRVRKQFQGWDDAEVMLSDEALQPTTLEEYVADLHSRVPGKGEGTIAYYSYGDGADRVIGLQDETGYGKKTGADTKGFAPWLAPKGKGMSLQKYAETIHAQLPDAIRDQYSDQDVRNAILEVFGGAERPSDIPLMVIRRGVLQAEQAARRMEEAIIDGDISFQKADRSFATRLRRAIEQTSTEPTEKQKEAGNYAKGHLSFGGYHFTIENPKGSMRRGTDADGKAWEQKMNDTYGYILGKKGKDGDHLDMFINDKVDLDNWNGNVYVVDQIDPKTGKLDEHKILYGYGSEEEARQAYLSNYKKGWKGLGKITGVDKATFDKWLDSSDKKQKEFADHSIIKHKVESQIKAFDQAVNDLNNKGLSLDNKDLLDRYGLKSVTLSKRGNTVSMTHLVANKMGEGSGTRFMDDFARLADEKGWTLALTPGLGLGAKSKRRLEQFYKRFGFKPNKGRNADYTTMEAMVRHPKDWNPDTPERQEQALRDAVIDHLRNKGVEVSTDWEFGQKIIDRYNSDTTKDSDKEIDFFKTPDGHAYGFTYNGRIYVDPRIATSETPIHEYGHLWIQAKRQADPEEWNEIKNVMLNDQLVQPIINKIKQQYPELTKEGREDDLAEEIITQFSGKRGNERLQQIANEVAAENGGIFGKAEAVTAMQRLKNILNRFWEGVAKMMGWKYRTANQIADKIMADMLNGVDVRRERNRRRIAAQKAEENKPIFISNAQRAVEGIKQEKATPDQWLAMIEKNGGLKVGEDKWLGLSDWLKEQQAEGKKSITKQEIEDYIRKNHIQVEETRYVEGMPEKGQEKLNEFNQEFEELIWEGEEATNSIYTSDWVDWAYEQMAERYGDDFKMAFEMGEGTGTNTRLTPALDWNDEITDAAKHFLNIGMLDSERPIDSTRLDYTTEGLDNKREIALTVPTIDPYNEADEVHFGDAGEGRAVAWARFGDTTDQDGNRVLVTDEIQSKRHQDAREQGGYKEEYKAKIKEAKDKIEKFKKEHSELDKMSAKVVRGELSKEEFDKWRDSPETKALVEEHSKLWDDYDKLTRNAGFAVPEAPFEKNWHELAMKRILRLAAEEGYDKVAWTTGDQQAERYDIGTKVKAIHSFEPDDYAKKYGEFRNIQIDFHDNDDPIFINVDKNGKIMSSEMNELRDKNLSEVLGKDLASKILSDEAGSSYEGNDLRIGGEGMRGFYDEILPRFMNKYTKKWGTKVEKIELPNIGETMWSVDVTPEIKESVMQGQPMFQKAGEDTDKTLMGMHNISEDKLKKAIKLGGLANPSLAVFDTNKYNHTDYGEISLIPTSSLIDSKTGRNAGTFSGDAWTPTYPGVSRFLTKKGDKHRQAIAKEVAAGDPETERHILGVINDWVEGNGDRMHWLFLKQKGLEPEILPQRTTHSHEEFEEIQKILGEGTSTLPSYGRTPEQDKALIDLMTRGYEEGVRKQAQMIKDESKREAAIQAMLKRKLDNLVDKDGNLYFAPADTYVYEVWRDEQKRKDPKPDWYTTDNEANYRVAKEGLAEEYEKWKEQLLGDEDIDEKLFAGWTADGNKRYVSNTVQNASRIMNKEAETNAYGNGGLSASKSALLKKLKTLSEIRKYRHLLKSGEEIQDRHKEMEDEWFDIIHQVSDMQKIDSNPFINIDIAEARLQEAMTKRDPIAHLNKEYGYDIDKNSELASQLMNFIDDAKQIPVKYFETKFKRPVGLNEFAIAVVPTTTSPEVVKSLKDAGLVVKTYERGSIGDENDQNRIQAVKDAVNSRSDIMFQMVGEKGATEADKAEGKNSRQESLNVANELEKAGKDSKAIKFATGWERGKDGQWRYETVDQKVDILGADKRAAQKWRAEVNELRKKEDSLYKQYVALESRIPKRLDSRYTEEQKVKYREMRKQREDLWRQYLEAGDEYREKLDDTERTIKLSDVLGDDHELFKYYPQLKDIDFRITPKMGNGVAGSYNPEEGIKINWHETKRFDNEDLNNDNLNGILVHEIQHAIQDIEGFAKGGNLYTAASETGIEAIIKEKLAEREEIINKKNVLNNILNSSPEEIKLYAQLDRLSVEDEIKSLKSRIDELTVKEERINEYVDRVKKDKNPSMTDARELYRRLAGEVEARNASERINMSEEDRRRTPIEKTEDYARDRQVVIMDYDTGESMNINDIKPVGTGNFGDIYDQFKGKPKEAIDFLIKKGDGDTLGVFHRDELGDIDLVWGTSLNPFRGKGLKHIIRKHINWLHDFKNTDELAKVLEDVINNGKLKDDYSIEKDGYRVVVAKEGDGKRWVLTAFDTTKTKKEKASRTSLNPPSTTIGEGAVSPDAISEGKDTNNIGTIQENNVKNEGNGIKFQKVTDPEDLEKLEKGPTVKRYRAMQLIDGKLYPPMSAKVDGQMRQPTEIGVWEKAEERPDLVKNGKFVLNKAQKGQGTVPAAYNPYFHTSTSGLNDQFTSAYKRPELVVVEVEIPESELTSGYKAEGAKDAVGNVDWHSGVVNGQLPADRQRQVTLSRYSKVDRIVPDSEVADMIAKQLDGTDIEVPYNVVTPQLRKALEEKGVKISAQPAGSVTEDINGNPIQGPKFQKVDAPTFYSNAEKAVENIKQDKATPEQWLAMIQKNGGLKAGEDKWLGLSDWLQSQKDKKSITKQEVMDYIRENQVQVKDVKYASEVDRQTAALEKRLPGFTEAFKIVPDDYNEGFDIKTKNDQKAVELYNSDTDNYPKIELTDGKLDEYDRDEVNNWAYDITVSTAPSSEAKSINSTRKQYTTRGLKNNKEIALVVPSIESYKEGDKIHFGDAGDGRAVAWVRFGDTYSFDESETYKEARQGLEELKKKYNGYIYRNPDMTSEDEALRDKLVKQSQENTPIKKKVLVVDEIQSKRHQDGREMGYKGEYKKSPRGQYMEAVFKVDAARNMIAEKYGDFWVKEDLTEGEQKRYQELYDDMVAKANYKDDKAYSVPDAPFEKNWHELAMKRMLRYAAENGYDKIAWTTGAQQAERYDLATVVRSIRNSSTIMGAPNWYTLVPQGGAQIRFHVGEDGKIDRVNASGYGELLDHTLSEVFGKDAAPKIESLKDNEVLDFESQTIGGEGMKGFYDEILPRFMNKYGKKWGVKVEETELPNIGETMWSIDVTPEMKESVMQGQPMFQREGTPEGELTPEERQYWNKYSEDLKKWKERNAIPEGTDGPGEKPKFQQGETALAYAQRLMDYNRAKALWQTAPRLENYRQKREDKDLLAAARENEQRFPDSPSAKMRRVAAELQQIRHAMSQQKAYDKATVKAVTDFAQDFMKMGFGDNLSRGEMERMLSSVKNATGASDIKKQVDNILNILMDNHLRNLEQKVVKLSSVKELSKTAQGVEKQGKLELKGQRMIQAFREAREGRMKAEDIRQRLFEVAEKMSRNDEEAPMWEQEYEGLSIALQYAENIEASRDEWAELDHEYNDAVKNYKSSGRSYKAQQELLESLDQAMMENKIERIGLYGDLIGRLEGNIAESMQGAKEFVEREKQRVNKIHSIANFDLAGKDTGAFREVSKGKPANFFLQPLGTFEQMLKQFGERNAKGEGNLYNYFMRNWADATDNAFLGEQKAKEELDAKAREVFGGKVRRWSDLYDIARKLPTMDVELLDGEDPKTFTLNQGNLMYIYMADKMTDGRMKLRKMGIDEEKVQDIKDFLDSRLVQLADWLQDEYLPQKRTEYNKVHERMFGAPMAAVDHYFPIKILGDARVQEQDVANMADQDAVLPSTITGNIIKRRKNTLPLDILHTDALSLAIEHVENMEHWRATAEWNKDINTLLSYTTFRNKVKNMKTIYGSGDAFWNSFADAARMAAGTYRPKAKPGSVDAAISNIAKGVTAAKINFRVYTAFKQILSAPAFLHDVNLGNFVKDAANPYGSWKWAMENLPMFKKRWKSRQVGDTRLMDDPTDWKLWKTNIVKMATRIGMSPNALVDGVTCAVGAKAIYESRYKQYRDIGASEEVARKRALQDAEIGYNLTQQSSEGAFVSAIQKDRTVAANMLSVFRNSSMAYTRQWVDAARNLKHRMQKGYKEDSITFMTRQFQDQFGLDEDRARQAAEAEYNRAGRHEFLKMLNMMFGVTMAWNLGASLPYLLIGDDDKTKKEMVKDAAIRGLIAGPTEGFAAGNIWSELISRSIANEQFRKSLNDGWGAAVDTAIDQGGDYEINPLPLMADLQGMIKKLGYDKFAAAQDVLNICMQSAVGVNPQTFTDMWNACMDYGAPGWDGSKITEEQKDFARPKEIALFIMRLMNAPTSSWKNKYIDELGMEVEDAKKLPYEEMARRYAHYKHWKDTPILGWLRGESGRAEKMQKIQKQFDKAVQERMDRLTDAEIQNNLVRSESAKERRMYAKMIANRLGLTPGSDSKKPKEDQWYQNRYQKYMLYEDIREDEMLAEKVRKLKKLNLERNKESLSKIKQLTDWIRDGKYDTKTGRKGKKDPEQLYKGKINLKEFVDDQEEDAKKQNEEIKKQNEEIMNNIRKWRKEALEIALRAEAE